MLMDIESFQFALTGDTQQTGCLHGEHQDHGDHKGADGDDRIACDLRDQEIGASMIE